MDHADGAFDDLLSSIDECISLLLFEHAGSHICTIGKVRDFSFDDLDACKGTTVLNLFTEKFGDLFGASSEGRLVFVSGLVGEMLDA